jgi:hypothetical protein
VIRHRYLPSAREELNEAAAFYEVSVPGVGEAFLDDVERAITTIQENPGINNTFERTVGHRGPRLAAAQRWWPAAQLGGQVSAAHPEEVFAMLVRFMVAAFFVLNVTFAVYAAEIKVLAGSAIQPVMNGIIPAFEQKSGHRVVFDYGTVGGMAQRVQRGETADLAVVSGPQMDALQRDGKVLPETRLDLGKTGVGVFLRRGDPKPDISSVESFKRAKYLSTPDIVATFRRRGFSAP